jgi:hypothetical protein
VTGHRRWTIFATATLLAAGCGATLQPTPASPSAAPSAAASVAPSPTLRLIQTYPPTEPPATTPEPSHDTCPAAAPIDQPAVWLHSNLARVNPAIEITQMARIADPATELPLPQLDHPKSQMSFVGGRRSFLDLFYIDFDWPWGWNVTSLSATLTPDGRKPIDLDVELGTDSLGNTSGASVRIPDRAGMGVLDVDVVWYDTCFTYEGSVSSPVLVYAESSVADCPTRRTGAFLELDITFDPPILVDGVEVDLRPWLFAGKVADMAVIDPLPPYVGFNADTPIVGIAASATVIATYDNPLVSLPSEDQPKVSFYERGPLLRWLEGGWIQGDEPEAPVVFRSKLVANGNADGAYTFEAPPEPGRYAAAVTFDYDSACTMGSAGFVVGMDVG